MSESINNPFSKAQPITMTQFVLQNQQLHPEAKGNLSILLHSIEIAVKYISAQVGAAGILNLYGAEGSTNVQGEVVKKLDVVANEAFITALTRSNKVCVMVSEENEDPIIVSGEHGGSYAVVFDPLDGSSNIDANVTIGTIFGIYARENHAGCVTVDETLKPGRRLVAAGYALYGTATILMLGLPMGVYGFSLDRTLGEFVLTHNDVRIKPKGNIYSINEGNAKFWDEATRRYVDSMKNPAAGSPYSMRYVGSMAADVHRTLLYGGVFMYPADARAKEGKLRLLYEANPMAYLVERAGGKAVAGAEPILDIVPRSFHQRVPVILGSSDDIDRYLAFVKECAETKQ
jgi:fructose-1,6-bisphosphatase I